MGPDEIVVLLREAAARVFEALEAFEGQGASGERNGQYALDLVADAAACEVLIDGGLSVFSEESGARGDGEILVVLDPVDGSTNCDRGIPFFSISLCAMDSDGPLASMVENLVTRDVYEAIRGRGATRNDVGIQPSSSTRSSGAVIGVNGILSSRPSWGQVRTMGSAALELCLVADGGLDGYVQVGGAAIHPWDYLAGVHIVQEAGGVVRSSDGEDLFVRAALPRRPLAAATPALADQLLEDLADL
jgi:fructose-1,6-bisphosphatase/inositol monophosphatase family enzyme